MTCWQAQLRAGVKYETSDVNNKELPSYAVEADDAADELNSMQLLISRLTQLKAVHPFAIK